MLWSMVGPAGHSRHPPVVASPEAEDIKQDGDGTSERWAEFISALPTDVLLYRLPGAAV